MLILCRRRNERIYIGNHVVIEVTDMSRDRVWIGVRAPESVRIYREEVLVSMLAREQSTRERARRTSPAAVEPEAGPEHRPAEREPAGQEFNGPSFG